MLSYVCWQTIKDISFVRKAELKLIYDRDLQIEMARYTVDGKDFIDSVSREIVCNRMTGLEGKRIPYQIPYDDEDDV